MFDVSGVRSKLNPYFYILCHRISQVWKPQPQQQPHSQRPRCWSFSPQALSSGVSSRQHQEIQNALLHALIQCSWEPRAVCGSMLVFLKVGCDFEQEIGMMNVSTLTVLTQQSLLDFWSSSFRTAVVFSDPFTVADKDSNLPSAMVSFYVFLLRWRCSGRNCHWVVQSAKSWEDTWLTNMRSVGSCEEGIWKDPALYVLYIYIINQ